MACALAGWLVVDCLVLVVLASLDEPAHKGAHSFVVRSLTRLDDHVGLVRR